MKISKKTDNLKPNGKKDNNTKTIAIIIFCIIISISVLSITFVMDAEKPPSNTSILMSGYLENLSLSHTFFVSQNNPYFDHYLTQNDFIRFQNGIFAPNDGTKITFKESVDVEFLERMISETNSVVIYPIFTSAAYQPGGFYDYYAGNCDESCITNLNFEYSEFDYNGSGLTAQILFELGYDFLTDVDVDKNPEILQNYDTVILLHNEYVTKNQFDAISSHPNLIFLFPNALYAEIDVDYDANTMTLIRGHNYPPDDPVANGFGYEIEERFHEYEYDAQCLDWEFVEIENGYHLNCYPDGLVIDDISILKKLKELI
jgi:hypothetical protein